MANILGMECGTELVNTGKQKCDAKLGYPTGLLSVETGYGIPITSTIQDTLYVTLETKAANNDPSLRLYPLFGVKSVTDNTQDRTVATAAGTGDTQTLRDAKPSWLYTFWPTICMWAAFEAQNGQEGNRDYYVVTDTNQLVGITRNNAVGGLRLSDIYVSPLSFRGDDAPSVGTISMTLLNTEEWRKNITVIVPTDGDLSNLVGLSDAQPIDLNAFPLPVAGTVKIGVVSGCAGGAGSTSLIPTYEAILEDTDNWVVSNATTGAAITLTSITATVNGNASFLTFVMPTTSPYVAGQNLKFKLADVTTLDAAGMPGFEGKSVIVKN
jgi:hypothetical protein